MENGMADLVTELVKSRDSRLLIGGFLAGTYALAVTVREQGYSAKDYRSDNVLFTAGGLKGAQVPPDYLDVIYDTFNLADDRVYQMYSMQELNSPFPRCHAGRYHVTPWVVALPLDEPGEELLDMTAGVVEGRAAFLDLSLDGRWGGVISGDKVEIDVGPCACGHLGPTVGGTIVRYSDLEAGDKITCAGTIDAYVRGAS
jgi:hypothetical protein